MTVREAALEEMETVIRPVKKSAVKCRQTRSRRIEAVFPAAALLVTKTHVHLANWLSAFEFDYGPDLEMALQPGLSYVFRAVWDSEAYEIGAGSVALSLEQIFDPDVDRYHFHPLCLPSYGGDRHRWNGHNGRLEIVCGTSSEAVGEKMSRLTKDQSVLVKKRGAHAGIRSLPRGCYSWKERIL